MGAKKCLKIAKLRSAPCGLQNIAKHTKSDNSNWRDKKIPSKFNLYIKIQGKAWCKWRKFITATKYKITRINLKIKQTFINIIITSNYQLTQ